MAANAYKTGTHDRIVAELIVAGFFGQIKGWQNYYLTNQQQENILNSMKKQMKKEYQMNNGNTKQDVVATLILTISLHFIGDHSHLKDKNGELLSNLICKKLSDFQWYKKNF